MIIFIIVGVIISVVAIWAIVTYNSLVSLRNQVKETWSGIDVQLKRRHDLIPNLVNTVKGYVKHEQETLQRVIEARNAARQVSSPEQTAKAEGALNSALQGINMLAESYPDLKANQNFMNIQTQMGQLEDEIQASRRIYNNTVSTYNTKREMFPNTLISGGFKQEPFFELENPEIERQVPNVDFS